MPAPTRLLIAGAVRLNGSEPQQLELWASDHVAVAFAGATKLGVLTSLTVGWDDERRLRLTGLDLDGLPTVWQAQDAERVSTRWANAPVRWTDGDAWVGATVTGSQHGVRVVSGAATRDIPGARLQSVGSQRWIVNGSERIAASSRGGCGCGGRRQ